MMVLRKWLFYCRIQKKNVHSCVCCRCFFKDDIVKSYALSDTVHVTHTRTPRLPMKCTFLELTENEKKDSRKLLLCVPSNYNCQLMSTTSPVNRRYHHQNSYRLRWNQSIEFKQANVDLLDRMITPTDFTNIDQLNYHSIERRVVNRRVT